MGRRPRIVATFLAGACLAMTTAGCTDDDKSNAKPPSQTTTTLPAAATPGDAALREGTVYTPDPKATRVEASGDGNVTAAFRKAMDAALGSDYRRPGGPDGNAQAVVYVPAGTYRILDLEFRDNVRLEVDAAAVLQQAGGRNAGGKPSKTLILWDGETKAAPLRNVSLVGVGTSSGGLKERAEPIEPGWRIDNAFTLHLDPKATDARDKTAGLVALDVDGFLVENVFSIQNADDETPKWPTTARAAIVLRSRNDSGMTAPFKQPRNGTILHHYNVEGPRGYGPNQINAVENVRIAGVFTRGGTALRLETDATKNKSFSGEIRNLRAETIAGVDCNRAVSFAPHGQTNTDVEVRGVVARGCAQGIIESDDESMGAAKRGSFQNSRVSDVLVIAGPNAQNAPEQRGTPGAWQRGVSQQAFARDSSARWNVTYSSLRCSGEFAGASDRLTIDGAEKAPCK